MPKYDTRHVVKTVHVCPVHLLHCKIYITTFFISQRAELKTVYFLLLPGETRWRSECRAPVHSVLPAFGGGLQMVHKNPQRFQSLEQAASRFLLASIMIRARGHESMPCGYRALLWFWKSTWSLSKGHLFHAAILSRIWSTRRERSLKEGRWLTLLFQHSVMIT